MDITTDFGSVILGSNPGRGTGNKNGQHVIMLRGGYGLVVERVLAKDETGVRFSLSAQKSKVDKGVNNVDKGQMTFYQVREIVRK